MPFLLGKRLARNVVNERRDERDCESASTSNSVWKDFSQTGHYPRELSSNYVHKEVSGIHSIRASEAQAGEII